VAFSHRGDEVAAQAASGALRYDVSYDPDRCRWYLDASWRLPSTRAPSVEELRDRGVLGVDLNAGHLAAVVVDRVQKATDAGCPAIAIEDLDFARARSEGREHTGRRPSRGRKGRRFRGMVAGIPTARFPDRLVQMAANRGIFVIAVDPAYTSRWGAEHWLGVLRSVSAEAGGHHCAAPVIARRGLGQRARRRGGCDSTPPEDGQERATDSAVQPSPVTTDGLPEVHHRNPRDPEARGRPQRRRRTQPADGITSGDHVAHDRSGPPAGQDSALLSV